MLNGFHNGWLTRRVALGALLFVASVAPVAAASLVFSELMYNPVGAPTNAAAGDEYEFIELYNAGATNVDLSGAQFTAGIAYTFTNAASLAPGGYAVIARNRALFTNRYPVVANLAPGVYTGSLNNAGEKVTLKTAGGATIFSATYGSGGDWSEWADGHGASLVLAHPDGDPDSPTNWCASAQYNGTPGATGVCATLDVVINEVLTHTDPPLEDAVELYNRSASAINLHGWYLSDQAEVRKKYRITNLVIAAGGFAVLYEYQFNTNAFFNTNNIPFSFSSAEGDQAYLTAADGASNLTRIADVVTFEAAENGFSFGRHPNGTGDLATMSRLTFGTNVSRTNPPGDLVVFRTGTGATNAAPRVGPVLIAELMYNPANGNNAEEYIELFNEGVAAVPLFDLLNPTNTWKLASAVDFTFPTGVTLAAGARLLVAGASDLTAFRTAYNLSTNVAVYGPWSGNLANGGESVRLYKPDPPQTNGFVPYVLVDRVDYGDATPWPNGPDGNGPSLERVVATNFGNDAANWFTGAPGGSPGVASAGGFNNPLIRPTIPVPGQALTVTVAVVAQALPTQVLVRTEVNGFFSNRVMRDDGVAPDTVAGDHTYAAAFVAPTNAWLHYLFLAYSNSTEAFRLPARERNYLPAPTITLHMCYNGVTTTVQPVEEWTTYTVTGTVSDADCFQLYLNAAGEALVDDVQMFDAGGTNHLLNSGFSAPLAGSWLTNSFNHQRSYRDTAAGEGTNAVLHALATGSGNLTNFSDSVTAFYSPTMAVATPAVLSFRTRQASYDAEPWLALLIGSAPAEVVLNEVMYHPVGTNEISHEYVELFNPGAGSVNLADWILTGVGAFRFPTGTVLAAGNYLVVAGDTQVVAAVYSASNVVGRWSGDLANSGERIRLRNTFDRIVDECEYGDSNPWPVAADGWGPSLERRGASFAATNPASWGSSLAETNWQLVTWTGVVNAANGGLRYFLDFDGMCWVDDVSVTPAGGGGNLVTNGNFEAGTNGWMMLGNHLRSRVVSGAGRSGSAALGLYGAEIRLTPPQVLTGVELHFGDALSNQVRSAVLPATNGASYVVSYYVRREGNGDSAWGVLDGATNRLRLGSRGTAGRVNSLATTSLPPRVVWVTTATNLLPSGLTNLVRARIEPAGLATGALLRWRAVGTNGYFFTGRVYTNAALRDDGVAPDTLAGDGEFAAFGPAAPSNYLVRFHVQAFGSNGLSSRWPEADDPSYDLGWWVLAAPLQTNIPNWQVLSDAGPVVYPVATRACAVSPDGQVFTDIELRHRGRPGGSTSTQVRTGIALRMYDGRRYDAWFADGQEGINFRSRLNDHDVAYTRVVAEVLAYDVQRQLGFPTPRLRHAVAWLDGVPSITTELEAPEEDYLDGNDIPSADYVSRSGYTGRRQVGGDPALDNYASVRFQLETSTGQVRNAVVYSNLVYESVQHGMAFLNAVGNGDQYIDWNMFQHRRAFDGRWAIYPWDLDICFNPVVPYTLQTTNMHPYYQTPLHPSIIDTNFWQPLGTTLFHPESGADAGSTLPYRFRQQATLWRYCHTWFTTSVLSPRVDALVDQLRPVYIALDGGSATLLTNKAVDIKGYISSRRDFFTAQSWSDKMTGVWAAVYAPTGIVVSEIMVNPLTGGEYVELYNTATQAVDASGWHVSAGAETYRLPFGTMIGPTGFLVIADTQTALTNAFAELGAASNMVVRFPNNPLWDGPLVFTSATEYATRVVEVAALTLPNTGATVVVRDPFSNVIDSVTYGVLPPWPTNAGWAIEVIHPLADNQVATNWRLSSVVGTPGWRNSATADQDADGLDDGWEQRIVAASGGSITSVTGVLAAADFDGDGMSNGAEYLLGLDPIVADGALAKLDIRGTNGGVRVAWNAIPATGAAYQIFSGRFYDLRSGTNLLQGAGWTLVPGYEGILGAGQTISYTNTTPLPAAQYRYQAELQPLRP